MNFCLFLCEVTTKSSVGIDIERFLQLGGDTLNFKVSLIVCVIIIP